jgi:transposase
VLDAGPAACGYSDECWTLARIAEQVWRRFGAEYTLAGMDVLLHRLGWSVQVLARRALLASAVPWSRESPGSGDDLSLA